MPGFEAIVLEIQVLQLGLNAVENTGGGSEILGRVELHTQTVPLEVQLPQSHGLCERSSINKLKPVGGQIEPTQTEMQTREDVLRVELLDEISLERQHFELTRINEKIIDDVFDFIVLEVEFFEPF